MSLHVPCPQRLRSRVNAVSNPQVPSRGRTSKSTNRAPAPILTADKRYDHSSCRLSPRRLRLCCTAGGPDGLSTEPCSTLMDSLLACSMTCCAPWAVSHISGSRLVCHADTSSVSGGAAEGGDLPAVSVMGALPPDPACQSASLLLPCSADTNTIEIFSGCVTGIGLMGNKMARRLQLLGYATHVWNRDSSKAQPLAEVSLLCIDQRICSTAVHFRLCILPRGPGRAFVCSVCLLYTSDAADE